MASTFQSFDESLLGAMTESPLGVRGGALVDACTVQLDFAPRFNISGENVTPPNVGPVEAGQVAFANLKAIATWSINISGTSERGTFDDSPDRFKSGKHAGMTKSDTLTSEQVTCITTEATTAKVEITIFAQKPPVFSDHLGDVIFMPFRINLSLSETTFAGPNAMYAAAAEKTGTVTDEEDFTSVTTGDTYRKGLLIFSGIDISQFSSVTTSDVIRMFWGIDSAVVAPLNIRPTQPFLSTLIGPNLNSGDFSTDKTNGTVFARIVFQKPE